MCDGILTVGLGLPPMGSASSAAVSRHETPPGRALRRAEPGIETPLSVPCAAALGPYKPFRPRTWGMVRRRILMSVQSDQLAM